MRYSVTTNKKENKRKHTTRVYPSHMGAIVARHGSLQSFLDKKIVEDFILDSLDPILGGKNGIEEIYGRYYFKNQKGNPYL